MKNPLAKASIAALLILLFLMAKKAVREDSAALQTSGSIAGTTDEAENVEGQTDPVRVRSMAWTPAKIHSLLNLREGELGMIRIPPDALERHFPVEEGDLSAGGVSRVFSPEMAAVALEAVSREGSPLTAKLGEAADGLRWDDGGLNIEIEGGVNSAAFAVDLRVSLNEPIGRTRTSISLYAGQSLLIRARDPLSSGYLVTTGKLAESE